jgi:aspartate carbamoyltransferase catalytic subunit
MTLSTPHFLSTQLLSQNQILSLLDKAQAWISPTGALLQPPALLKNKIVANLFFENSTRTRCSFEIAANKLGAYVLNFNTQTSSVQKGETLLDTIDNLQAMGSDLFVIRHGETGVPAQVAKHLGNRAAVINAGDGSNEHPTQAMLDILTIRQHKPDFSQLVVAIVGDIRHSRVARSLCFALNTLGVPDIRLIGPDKLLPTDTAPFTANISFHPHLMTGIDNADVVVMLRIQHERINKADTAFDLNDYVRCYCLTKDRLQQAKPDAIVMHPGPMNRGIEIESEVADASQSVILEQAKLGVAMRMAIMTQIQAA